MKSVVAAIATLILLGCAQGPYERGGHPQGYSRYDVERDYRDCEAPSQVGEPSVILQSDHPSPIWPRPSKPC